MRHQRRLVIAVLLCGLPAVVLAWTPYGPPLYAPGSPYGPMMYGYGPGAPLTPGRAQHDTEQIPPDSALPEGSYPLPESGATPLDSYNPPHPWPYHGFNFRPYGALPPMGPTSGFDALPRGPMGMFGSRGLSVETTDDAYLVSIDTRGVDPDGIQITPRGQGLIISREAVSQTVQEDTLSEGQGYRRSFSFSRGSSSRRIPLPPDADLTRIVRETTTDALHLRIPRIRTQGFGSQQAPVQGGSPGTFGKPLQ